MENKIIVETSARHVHVTEADLAVLFGAGHELTFKKALSQTGQFASEEQVDLVGPKGKMAKVRILGPVRKATQVEISLTDARSLGINAPVRESGDVEGSGAVTIVGPAGSIDIPQGAIAAKRHIHLDPQSAASLGVVNGQIVSIKIDAGRPLIFGDTVVRVNENFTPAVHIDTDESNAAGCAGTVYCEIIK